jgi:hypothetical protein
VRKEISKTTTMSEIMYKSKNEREESDCRVCGNPTKNLFNISFSKAPICEYCAESIFIQQANWYVEKSKQQ